MIWSSTPPDVMTIVARGWQYHSLIQDPQIQQGHFDIILGYTTRCHGDCPGGWHDHSLFGDDPPHQTFGKSVAAPSQAVYQTRAIVNRPDGLPTYQV